MDVAKVRQEMGRYLETSDFRNDGGADKTDYVFGRDQSLRFKVSTSYKEVTVTCWKYQHQFDVIRINTPEQTAEAKHKISALINEFFTRRANVYEESL